MAGSRHIANTLNPVYRTIAAALLVAAAVLVVPAAQAFNSGDIVVDSAKGDARLAQAGKERAARRGMVVLVPATLRTGRDGIVDLRQGTTLVNVGPETVLEFPAAQERGAPVERIVQSRGNAFYDISKRDGRKLRVETPYLVAVIKGTQFSVSVQDGLTSISLVEGSLEILSPDGGATVDLVAGEIATRRQGDAGITVVDIATAQVRGPGAGAGTGTADVAAIPAGPQALPGVGTNVVDGVAVDIGRTPAGTGVILDADVGRGVIDTGAAVTVAAGVTGIDVSAGIGAGEVATVDVAASVDAGPAAVAVEAGAGVDAGIVGAEVGVGAGVDLSQGDIGASVDVDAGVAVGPVEAEVVADTGIDVGQSGASIDIGAGAAVDAGSLGVDVDAGLSADLGGGSGSLAVVEVDAGAGVAGIDAGVSAGVDLGAGTVEVGVDLGIVDLDVGLDLGLDDTTEDASTEDADTDTEGGGIIENVGGLLDGLLRRPGGR
jgi:hypothetical protein